MASMAMVKTVRPGVLLTECAADRDDDAASPDCPAAPIGRSRAVEAVKANKQHYAAAEAQALLQPKSPMAGFMRSFVTSQVLNRDADD